MTFIFKLSDPAPKKTMVFARVGGLLKQYQVDTGDHNEARQEVIKHLDEGFRLYGAVLALVKS
jgi:hypothetical protein